MNGSEIQLLNLERFGNNQVHLCSIKNPTMKTEIAELFIS